MLTRRNVVKEVQEELAKKQYLESIEYSRAHIERKNKYRNLTRCLNDRRREEEEDSRTVQVKEHLAFQQKDVKQEQQLAIELDSIRTKEMKEKKQRQYLRENCHELKELESKLKAAYISKQQVAQMAEREAMKLQNKLQEKETNSILQSAWLKDDEYRKMTLQEDILRKVQYKRELQDQMILQERNKRFEYEEFLREKKMIDDIVQRIHDENEREIEEQMCKMKKTQQEINEFKAAQQVWREKHKQELAEENRKIQNYLISKANEIQNRQEEKSRTAAAKAKVCEDMAKKMYEALHECKEREDIITKLLEEEKKEEAVERHKQEIEKQIRKKMEILTSFTEQMRAREEQLKQKAEEEAKYKEELIAKIAEDERLEQLSNERKRRKLLEVRRTVEQMMTARRQQKAEQMQLQMKILEDEKKQENERKRLIQEERIKILQEHASNLIGYLPKGILCPDDLPYLGSDIVNKYGSKYMSEIYDDKLK